MVTVTVPSNSGHSRSLTDGDASMTRKHDASLHPKGCKGSVASGDDREADGKPRRLIDTASRRRRKATRMAATEDEPDIPVFGVASGSTILGALVIKAIHMPIKRDLRRKGLK